MSRKANSDKTSKSLELDSNQSESESVANSDGNAIPDYCKVVRFTGELFRSQLRRSTITLENKCRTSRESRERYLFSICSCNWSRLHGSRHFVSTSHFRSHLFTQSLLSESFESPKNSVRLWRHFRDQICIFKRRVRERHATLRQLETTR